MYIKNPIYSNATSDVGAVAQAVTSVSNLKNTQISKRAKEAELIYNTACVKPLVPKTFINKRKWEKFEKCLKDREQAKNDLEKFKLESERLRIEKEREEIKLKTNLELEKLKSNRETQKISQEKNLLGLPIAVTLGLGVILTATMIIIFKTTK